MKIFILSTPLVLLIIQVFFSCNCQLIPISLNGIPNFNPSSSTLKILKSADSTSFKSFQSLFSFGTTTFSTLTANLPSVNASELAKTVIANNAQNDLTKIMNALNAVATSLAGCIPYISYPNDLNISTSCFSISCSNTGVQCQALYIQIAIDELVMTMSTAEYNLNLTSSILVGNNWNYPSLSTVTTQWSIVQASAASYQSSTETVSLINIVNSSFKKVLRAALSGTSSFLNSFQNGYKSLKSALNVTNYNQTDEDYMDLNILFTTSSAIKNDLNGLFMLDGIILKASPVQSSIAGISVSSFVRPATIKVFESLAALSSSFNKDLSNFQSNMRGLMAEQQQNLTNLIVNAPVFVRFYGICLSNAHSVSKPSILMLKDNFQSAQNNASNLITNYTNLINSYTNMAIDCFKVGCTGNTIYPYSLWNLQCVNDISFTSFCLSNGFPKTIQQCPSAKAQALNACLNNVTSLITSLEPASDMNMVFDNTINLYIQLLNYRTSCFLA